MKGHMFWDNPNSIKNQFKKGFYQGYGFKKGCPPMNKLSLDEEEIINLYGKLSGKELAKKFNCSYSVIYRILKENNIKIKPNGFFQKEKPSPLRNKTYEEIYGKERAEKIRKKSIKTKKLQFKDGKFKENYLKKNKGCFKEGDLRISGKNHPNWNNGSSFEPYSPKFNKKFRKLIRKRDNYICMLCGIHSEKLLRVLDVHHINYDKKLTIPQNCCALCHKCNIEVNKNRRHWTKFFQSLLAEKYEYEYSETGEIVLNLNNIKNAKSL